VTELPFFATKVRLGRGGAEEILPLGPLNEFERYSPLSLSLNSAVIINLYITDSLNLKNSMRVIRLPLRRYRVGLEAAKKELSESIRKGVAFVNK